jgi:hypothetical protein
LAFQLDFEESIDLHSTISLATASRIIVAIDSSKLIAIAIAIAFIFSALGSGS